MKGTRFLMIAAIAGSMLAGCKKNKDDTGQQDVLINGVIWASRNLDTKDHFAAHPESSGRFFQWNRNTPWATTGSVTGWLTSTAAGAEWEAMNDPCPEGYRVPTKADFQKLIDATEYKWTTVKGVKGGLFKDKATGKSIFLPAVGGRQGSDGVVYHTDTQGAYWSSVPFSISSDAAWAFIFDDSWESVENNPGKDWGFCIRCVKK